MSVLLKNLFYVNLIFLIAGSTSIHMGFGFLRREKNSKGFFKYAVAQLSLGCGLCCMGYSVMALSPNLTVAYIFRVIGLLGINLYLIAEILLVASCLNISRVAEILIGTIASVAAGLDLIIYGSPNTDIFYRRHFYTSYYRADPYRHFFHYTYLLVVAICIFIILVTWALSVRYKRDKQLVFYAFLSNIIFAASGISDIIKPVHDIPFANIYYCGGVFFAYLILFHSANNYMTFYITVAGISKDIFSTIAAGLLVFDTNFHLNLANDYAKKILGLDKEPKRIRLKEIFDLKTGEPLMMFQKSQEGMAIDYRLTANVTGKAILVNFSCKMDRNNDPMCYILVATDLTEENRLIEEAQAANEAKTTFLSNISHEIRTPINIISGMNEMILRESNEANILKYSENINVASRSLTSIINDVLDFSKIESGKLEIVNAEFNIGSVLNDGYNLFLNSTKEKNQSFFMECDSNIPAILKGDENRLKQILSNLLSNAVKYTPEEGNITIKTTYKKIESNKIVLTIEVADNGIGIKAEDIPHIFENFKRLEMSRNRSIQGTGLGLAITKNLVTLLHGTISVDSEYGKGSSFIVQLPFEVYDFSPMGSIDEHYSAGTTKKHRIGFTAPEAHILSVDDVSMNLDVFTGLLKDTGIKIDCATSGAESLDLMGKNRYDIIFMDHMMPEMDGIEVLNIVKSDGDNPNINTPMIILTANATMGADRKYLENGFDDYLSKPIRPNALEHIVLKYLPKNLVIIRKDEDVEKEEHTVKQKGLIERLAFLDAKAGLEFAAGDEGFYRQILTTYVDEDKKEVMDEYLKNEDWGNYQIQAHALKGTSMTIGAAYLSEKAKTLEFAAKEGNYDYIKNNHKPIMAEYEKLIDDIRDVL